MPVCPEIHEFKSSLVLSLTGLLLGVHRPPLIVHVEVVFVASLR